MECYAKKYIYINNELNIISMKKKIVIITYKIINYKPRNIIFA